MTSNSLLKFHFFAPSHGYFHQNFVFGIVSTKTSIASEQFIIFMASSISEVYWYMSTSQNSKKYLYQDIHRLSPSIIWLRLGLNSSPFSKLLWSLPLSATPFLVVYVFWTLGLDCCQLWLSFISFPFCMFLVVLLLFLFIYQAYSKFSTL